MSSKITEIILAVHGIGAQKDWLEPIKNPLESNHVLFYNYDLKGFGKNTSECHGDIHSYKEWVNELEEHYHKLQTQYPQARITILGHSLGAVITSCLKTIRNNDRLILSVAGFKGADSTFQPTFVAKVISLFALSFITRKQYYVELPVSEKLQDFPLMDDPLRTKKVTPRLLIEVLRMGKFAKQNILRIQVPILMLQVEDDIVVSNQIQDQIFDALKTNKTKRTYSNIDHDWIWSDKKDIVVNDIINWIKQ